MICIFHKWKELKRELITYRKLKGPPTREETQFYYECEKCTRYVEIWRKIKQKRTTHYKSEGG